MANIPLISFNAGELTPKIDARSDIEKFSAGCRTLENMIPLIYGCAERRPGTEFIYESKNTDEAVRLEPFVYSSDVAYVLEFGNLYIRYYYDGAILTSGENPVETVTPYLIADIPYLQFKQVGDIIRIVSADYAPRTLSRVSPTSFSLDTIKFDYGPFLLRNDLIDPDETDTAYMLSDITAVGDTGTLTCQDSLGTPINFFQSGHVGSLFKLLTKRTNTVSEGSAAANGVLCAAIDIKGTFTYNTQGRWSAKIWLERNENGAGWETVRTDTSEDDVKLQLTQVETANNVQYRVRVSDYVSGTVRANLTLKDSTMAGIVRVTGITSASVAEIEVVVKLDAVEGLVATRRWSEGAFSSVRGFPCSVTFFEDRCVYMAMIDKPEQVTPTEQTAIQAKMLKIYCSKTGDYDNFELGDADSDAIELTIPTGNEARWVEAGKALIVGTSGDEWIVSSPSDDPLTSGNYSVRQHTNHGSKKIQAQKVNEAVLFVDDVGRKVREFVYTYTEDKYVAPDLTSLAEHITDSGIVALAYQKHPDSILWAVLSDGTFLSMTYERQQNVVAWARHSSGIVKSLCVIPGDDEDEIWLSVRRRINGADAVYIERMASRTFDTQSDCFFVDSGIRYSGTATATLSGLDHLVGESVAVLGDGASFPPETVNSSGEITLPEAVTKASVGLPFTYNIEPMRLDIRGGQGSVRHISELAISFLNTLGAQYGDGSRTYDIDWRTTEDYDAPPALYTGDKVVAFDGGFSSEDKIIISGDSPFPCTVRAIIPRIEKSGR